MITSTGTDVRNSSEAITKGSIHVPLNLAAKSPSGMPIEKTVTSVRKPSCAEIAILLRISSLTEKPCWMKDSPKSPRMAPLPEPPG